MSLFRPPVSLSITSGRVEQFGRTIGPYMIINQSLTETLYVGSTSALTPVSGTPISPGTSSTWIADSDLFLTATGPTNVILTWEIADWSPNPAAVAVAALNTGSIVRNTQVLLVAMNNNGLQFMQQTVDVTLYASIALSSAIFNNNSTDEVRIDFLNSGGLVIAKHVYSIETFLNGKTAIVPCTGPRAIVSFLATSGVLNDLRVHGISRIVEHEQYSQTAQSANGFASWATSGQVLVDVPLTRMAGILRIRARELSALGPDGRFYISELTSAGQFAFVEPSKADVYTIQTSELACETSPDRSAYMRLVGQSGSGSVYWRWTWTAH